MPYYAVFIVQAYQTFQYVVPRGGIFLGKWRSTCAGSSDGKMNVQSACALNTRHMQTDSKLIELYFVQKALSELKIITAEVRPVVLTILPGFSKVGRMVHILCIKGSHPENKNLGYGFLGDLKPGITALAGASSNLND
jgi:hypothetical protein